jgi:cell division septation protein DedD
MAGAGDVRDEEYWGNAPANADAKPGDERFDRARDADVNSRLPFDDDSDRLPWLEAEDEQLEHQGSDVGRLVGFFLLGLVVLAALVGGIWWASHRQNDATLVADGSILDEPGQPYKEAPVDPGGKTFEGTGDSSFAVSAGQDQGSGSIGNGVEVDPAVAALGRETSAPAKAAPPSPTVSSSAPKPAGTPSRAAVAAAPAKPEPAFTPVATSTAAATESGVAVQVGAYSNRATAEAGWSRLQQRSPVLKGLRYRVVEGQADIGTVFRLQVLPGDRGAAKTLCNRLKGEGIACQVKN